MNRLQKKLIIILVVAATIIACSIYLQCRYDALTDKQAKSEPACSIVVYVSGFVHNPGIVTLNEGARALDAVNAAGGAAPGANMSAVNLAQTMTDGMQLDIPGTAVAAVAGAQSAGMSADGRININTADKAELDKLPGIGPAMAERIISYRTEHGAFKSVEELKKVQGIGKAKFERLKDKVSL